MCSSMCCRQGSTWLTYCQLLLRAKAPPARSQAQVALPTDEHHIVVHL